MKNIGTIAYGIKTPIIKTNDNLEDIVINSIVKAQKELNLQFDDNDIIGITEAVVSISANNYISIDEIAKQMRDKYEGLDHIGVLFPILSRNRFSMILEALAKAFKKLTIMLSYPSDEVGNGILDEHILYKNNVNPYKDIISEQTYLNDYRAYKHPFTKLNMYDYYKELVNTYNCEVEFVFANDPVQILSYTKDILVASIHRREQDKILLKNSNANLVFDLTQIANIPNNQCGYNEKYGLLGSNAATKNKLKLFPNNAFELANNIQAKILASFNKNVEVLVYGDGAFKDPVGHIWELADPVVSPGFTKGLLGSPNEIKLKLLSDDKYANLSGESLANAIKEEILNKDKTSETDESKIGTTPRNYTDLIGSLCDLMSGSGDKGTPVIWIKNYFTNYAK